MLTSQLRCWAAWPVAQTHRCQQGTEAPAASCSVQYKPQFQLMSACLEGMSTQCCDRLHCHNHAPLLGLPSTQWHRGQPCQCPGPQSPTCARTARGLSASRLHGPPGWPSRNQGARLGSAARSCEVWRREEGVRALRDWVMQTHITQSKTQKTDLQSLPPTPERHALVSACAHLVV